MFVYKYLEIPPHKNLSDEWFDRFRLLEYLNQRIKWSRFDTIAGTDFLPISFLIRDLFVKYPKFSDPRLKTTAVIFS